MRINSWKILLSVRHSLECWYIGRYLQYRIRRQCSFPVSQYRQGFGTKEARGYLFRLTLENRTIVCYLDNLLDAIIHFKSYRRVAVEFCHKDLDKFTQCHTIPLFRNAFEAKFHVCLRIGLFILVQLLCPIWVLNNICILYTLPYQDIYQLQLITQHDRVIDSYNKRSSRYIYPPRTAIISSKYLYKFPA